ncbi:MAG: hypothetical protein GXO96_06540 [Nitrospirae bacterium]|nr:hypothetical protein [Candidatus Manganitrophaceae bacterium]
MADDLDIPIRDARDRLIDFLGFAQTAPLQDLSILDEQLTVPFNVSAKIPIALSQNAVNYQLDDLEDVPVQNPAGGGVISALGTGGTLLLESPQISDDVSYQVRATKVGSGRFAYLHETATVKVGLDLSLQAEILDLAFLEPTLDYLKFNDAKIVDYGTAVQINLLKSQEGVMYRLVYFEDDTELILSEVDVLGTLNDIVLSTQAVYEDTDIRIRATKTFDPAEGRETQTALLDLMLPLKVRANTALEVFIEPTEVIDFKASTSLKISNTQTSARYQLFTRQVADADFVFNDSAGIPRVVVGRESGDWNMTLEETGKTLLVVDKGEGETVQVAIDPLEPLWQVPEGFSALGTQTAGSGAALSLPVTTWSEDSFCIVQVEKTHQGRNAVLSAVSVSQIRVVFVRPNPEPELALNVTISDANAVGPVEVLGGEPGVYYHLRKKDTELDLALPAYIHQQDVLDPTENKGLNQLRIGVDFVVSRDISETSSTDEKDPTTFFPRSALLEMVSLSVGTSLELLAIKAQSGVTTPLLKSVDLAALPQISFENTAIASGQTARLIVTESIVGDNYQLFSNDVAVKQSRNGNGGELVFITEILTENTLFEVRVTQTESSGLPLTRIVPLAVTVSPAE